MKKVSIIIPVYNVAKYITRCLDSVSSQTYDKIECILIDDCGTDESMRIVEEYVKFYKGSIEFKLTYHNENRGQASARNTGILAATGDYLFFLDSDDAITNNCIEILINLSEKYPDADFIQANTVIGNDDNLMPYTFSIKPPEYCNNKEVIDQLILSSLTMTVWNRLIKRPFIINHSLFFPDGISCEDMYWIYFLAKKVKVAAFTDKGTYLYYKNSNSDSNSITWTNKYKHFQGQMIAARDFFSDILQSKHVSKYQRQYFAGNLVAAMGNLMILHSIKLWGEFWLIVCKIAWCFKSKTSFYRFLLFITMMPPICFIAGTKGGLWRIKHYIVINT